MRPVRSIIAWNLGDVGVGEVGDDLNPRLVVGGWPNEQHRRRVRSPGSKPNAQCGMCNHGPCLLIRNEVGAGAGPDHDLHP